MFNRRLTLLIALAASHHCVNTVAAWTVCGRDEVIDLSSIEPLPFGGEILGATIVEGQIIGTHFEITFTTSGNFDAANLSVTLVMPILPEHFGASGLGFSGFEAGWSGQGSFTHSIDTDALNGTLALNGAPFAFWYITVHNLNPEGGSISGHFDVWRYDLRFAPCPAGDADCNAAVTSADIAHFVEALLDPETYGANHPHCPITSADVNGDGAVNGGDVSAFARLLD